MPKLSSMKVFLIAIAGVFATTAPFAVNVVNAQIHAFVPWEAITGSRLMPFQGSIQAKEDASAFTFDVASVKPANPAAQPGRAAAALRPTINTGPGGLSSRSATVKDLIAAAYGLETYQVLGGPSWLESERFEVSAKSEKSASREQLLLMLRPLLKKRCDLKFHSETKEMSVYALTTTRNINLQKPKSDEQAKPALNHLVQSWDMSTLARFLTRFGADMPVVDRTGLPGDFRLDLDMDSITRMAQINNEGPTNESMFDATVQMIERQAGIKLVRTKAPIEVLFIDHVDRPSPN
jgi:uncharacterized protein (TIGR03435 family)